MVFARLKVRYPGARTIFLVCGDSFKLGATLSLASDLEDDLAIPMFDKEIGGLLACCGFQILDSNTRCRIAMAKKSFLNPPTASSIGL